MEFASQSFLQREEAVLTRLRHGKAEIDAEFLAKVLDFLQRHDGPVYLFGFASFANLGDHALWAALVRLLREIGDKNTRGLFSRPPAKLGGIDRNALIIFPGGGSLGNRYNSAKSRVRLIEAMQPKAIIQMPVSTTFADPGMVSIERVAQAYNSARSSLIFVRDTQSHEEATRLLKLEPVLAPDLSALLPNMADLAEKGGGTLYLLRQDQEAGGNLVAPQNSFSTDWSAFNKSASTRIKLMERLWWQSNRRWAVLKPLNIYPILKGRERLAASLAERQTARALALLGGFDSIVTDRLHGMLLAKKLGVPCVAIDNDHNKLSRYANTWLDLEAENIRFCDNIQDAV